MQLLQVFNKKDRLQPHCSQFIKALLTQGWHAVTHGIQLDALTAWQHVLPWVPLGEPWWIYHNIGIKSNHIKIQDSPTPCSQGLGSSTGRAVTPELWRGIRLLPKSWDFFSFQINLRTSLYTSVIGLNYCISCIQRNVMSCRGTYTLPECHTAQLQYYLDEWYTYYFDVRCLASKLWLWDGNRQL